MVQEYHWLVLMNHFLEALIGRLDMMLLIRSYNVLCSYKYIDIL